MTTMPRTIDPAEVPGKPPFKPRTVWEGEHGPWRLSAVRFEQDTLLHLVATHRDSGLVHAERVDAPNAKAVKAWADTLPVTVDVGAAP